MIAVGFDFDHTLGVDNGLERKAVLAVAADCGLELDAEAVRQSIETLLQAFRDGLAPLEESLPRFLSAHGARGVGAEIARRWRDHALALVDELVEPVAGARELLAALAERDIPVAVLTNGWSPLQERKLAAIGYRGPILVSAALGVAKPARAAFDLLVRELDAAHEECWYIGDTPTTDIVGARDAGLHGVWFDWEGRIWPVGVPAPETRIQRLVEFLTLIPGSGAAAENSQEIEWRRSD